MIRVIDSSAWIEWLLGTPLGIRLAEEIPDYSECIVPTIVQLELAKWLIREVGEERSDQFIAFTLTCRIVPLDTTLALRAADLCRQHRLATADAIVYATALHHDVQLLTCDSHFSDLANVIYFPRT